MRDIGNRRDVGDHAARIGEALDEDAARLVIHRRADVGGIVGIDETRFPAELAECLAHLVERAAIELLRRDDVAPRFHQRVEGDQLRGMAAGKAQRADPALQRRDLLLERIVRGVHDPRIDVAELLERKQVRGMLGAVEDIAGRLVDRRDPCIGRGVGLAPGMHGERFEFQICHGASCPVELPRREQLSPPPVNRILARGEACIRMVGACSPSRSLSTSTLSAVMVTECSNCADSFASAVTTAHRSHFPCWLTRLERLTAGWDGSDRVAAPSARLIWPTTINFAGLRYSNHIGKMVAEEGLEPPTRGL